MRLPDSFRSDSSFPDSLPDFLRQAPLQPAQTPAAARRLPDESLRSTQIRFFAEDAA